MSDKRIRPALPGSYWQHVKENPEDGWTAWLTDLVGFKNETAHEAAALALYGQPFGFDRLDVEELRDAAATLTAGDGAFGDEGNVLLSLADRIEALLPPETSA